MDAVLISTKGQIVLPIAVRRALGLKPGMRVKVSLDGKRAVLTAAPTRQTTQLQGGAGKCHARDRLQSLTSHACC